MGSARHSYPVLSIRVLLMLLAIEPDTQLSREQYEKTITLLRRSRSTRLAAMAESDWAHKRRHDGSMDEALANL